MSSKEEDQAVEALHTESILNESDYTVGVLRELYRAGRASSCWTKYP